MIWQLFWIAAGGALGALSRFGISAFAAKTLGSRFAWGTIGANLMGCLMIGTVLGLIEHRHLVGPIERAFFITGFLGALTTFSTYALESVLLLRGGAMGMFWVNVLINNVFGIAMVMVGLGIGRKF